jgi:hypothetical protein
MSPDKQSGRAPFAFAHRPDLSRLPAAANEYEVNLHGGFAVDDRAGYGQIYYGMPGCGLMRVEADLQQQSIISLPDDLRPLNFHSTRLAHFDGKWRLVLPANSAERVVVLSLDGEVDFVLPRPVFDAYQDPAAPYNPTDAVVVGRQLYIADGYGSNYITSADAATQEWTGIFGGRTNDPTENGKFQTAHGINFNPVHHHLDIADRPHSRIQAHAQDGGFVSSHALPSGAFVCGINYLKHQDRWYGVIGCLRDPEPGRPAPIYIIDAETYELLSVLRPKEELGIELAQHMHNVVLHQHDGQVYLVCQAWNPGHYFVLQMV